MIKSLHHADIIIPKGSESVARRFYCDLLGFKEIEKPHPLRNNGGLWLQLSNVQLHLSFEKREGVDPKKTKAHLAYEVDDLEVLKQKLLEMGFSTKEQTQIPNMVRFETDDPFGNRIEFLQTV